MLSKKILILCLYLLSIQTINADTAEQPTGSGKFIPIAVGGVTVIIPAPIKLDSPTGQAKRFVSAYLANDKSAMQEITSRKMIIKLRTVDSQVKSYFKTIKSYNEMLYFHDLKALVIAVSQGEEIKFYFTWAGNRWILDRVL